MREGIEKLATRLRRQAAWCSALGSPLYEALLEASADDLEAEGPVWDVLSGFEEEGGTSALSLRFMGAVHRLVLDGTLPELARHYPSTGGDGDPSATWPVLRRALLDHKLRLQSLIAGGCQTNEVGRSAALLGGFLEVAHRTRLPLRILEVGASAGLNLRWDRYRYESADGGWGDPESQVRFVHSYEVAPPMNQTAEVAERKGCDLNPIDPTTEEGALTLRAFVWADQLGRLAQLDGAIEIATEMPVEVEQIGAADFLERELRRRDHGVATVVYHSVFMQYVPEPEQRRIAAAVSAGPVFYLRMEPGDGTFEVRLGDQLLGTCNAHGSGVRWNVDSSSQ